MSDLNDQFLNDLFDKFSKEQMRILNDMKQGNSEDKDKDLQKQMTMLNTLAITVLRLRNHKKAQIAKINS